MKGHAWMSFYRIRTKRILGWCAIALMKRITAGSEKVQCDGAAA